MWAIFRYSTGRIVAYFTDERNAQVYCDANNMLDAKQGISATPDWGYKLMTVSDSIDELCEGLGDW